MCRCRTAEKADIAALSRVLAASWKSAYRGIVGDAYLDELAENHWENYLRVGLQSGRLLVMALEEEAKLTGVAIIDIAKPEKTAELVSFYLLPERIGRGFGHTFYTGIEAALLAKGFTSCRLDVLGGNGRAIRFYESHGFTDTGQTVSATLGDRSYTCKVYEKTIA